MQCPPANWQSSFKTPYSNFLVTEFGFFRLRFVVLFGIFKIQIFAYMGLDSGRKSKHM